MLVFFFLDRNLLRSKSFYAERSYVPRKRNTNKEKEGQQLTLKSFSNTLLALFTCSIYAGDFLSSVNKREISHLHQSACAFRDLRKHAVLSVNTSE